MKIFSSKTAFVIAVLLGITPAILAAYDILNKSVFMLLTTIVVYFIGFLANQKKIYFLSEEQNKELSSLCKSLTVLLLLASGLSFAQMNITETGWTIKAIAVAGFIFFVRSCFGFYRCLK